MINQLKELHESDFFREFSSQDVRDLTESAKMIELTIGDSLIVANTPANEVFFILSGSLQVRIPTADRSVPIAIINAGEFAGEGSLLGASKRNASVIARVPSRCVEWSKADLDNLFDRKSDLGVRFYKRIAYMSWFRLNASNTKLREAFSGIVEF